MIESDYELTEAVIKLHDIARLVEHEIGRGTLAADLRKCADQLNTLIKPLKAKEYK
jgi:hypothetical protein